MEHDLSVQDGYFTTCHLKRNFCGVSNNRSISAIDRERIDRQSANAQGEIVASTSASGNQTESQSEKENTAEKQRNPSVSNPHWEDENGKTLTKALVGDEVFLCADVTDIADGTTAKINIVEKDGEGNDDFVTELSAAVQDGKIRCDWKVIYTEDNDDTDSQKELQEEGYTLPEYAFTVECDGIESKESEQLDVMGWIKTQLINKRTGEIMKNKDYKLKDENNNIIESGKTDLAGYIYVKDLKIGNYKIVLEF